MKNLNLFKKMFDYKETAISTDLGLNFFISGYEQCSKKKKPIIYNKQWYTIHFVFEGSGYIQKGDRIIKVEKDSCFFCQALSNLTYYPDKKNPWKYAWIEFDGEKRGELLSFFAKNEAINVMKIQNMEGIGKVFEDIFSTNGNIVYGTSLPLLYTSELLKIIAILSSEHEQYTNKKGKTNKEIQVDKITSYIKANYNQPELTISQIAEKFFFSPSYFTRFFEAEKGISPVKYIIKIRMKAAVELLIKKHLSVSKVASAVGYRNPLYFSKEFKRYYQVSPSEYVLTHRE